MSHPLARLLPGRTLADRYTIREPLGHGGMSIVFAAKDRRLQREVAVKVLSIADREEGSSVRERFRREASAAAGIPPHPNVVQIFDFGTDEDLAIEFLVMERLHGEDLAHALRRGRLPREVAPRVLRDAARGVAAGHRAGIVHRDVKPANVFLVGGAGTIELIKILDFGIAKAMEATDPELTATGAIPHSPAYASPEQLASRTVTPASDVFQLGLIGFEIWTGKRPFPADAESRLQAIRAGIEPTDPLWKKIPEPNRQAILTALANEPEDRFTSAAGFLEALQAGGGWDEEAEEASSSDETAWETPADDATVISDSPDESDATIIYSPDRGGGGDRPGIAHTLRHHRQSILIAAGGALVVFLLILFATSDRGADPPVAVAPPGEVGEARTALFLEAFDAEHRAPEADTIAIIRVLRDMHGAWEGGEMARHAAHFAHSVYFHGETMSREEIRAARATLFERNPEARIDISEIQIEEIESGQAAATLVRDWSNRGPDDAWRTRTVQRYALAWIDGAWRVTREEDVEILQLERPRREDE